MQREDIRDLLERYNAGTCSDAEKVFVQDWYMQFEHNDLEDLSEKERANDLERIAELLPVRREKTRPVYLWAKVAAAVLLILSAGSYFMFHQKTSNYREITAIKPGSNKAVLTLANGQQIALTNTKTGKLDYQDSSVIRKDSSGQLVYDLSQSAIASPGGMNKIQTPTGGQYQVVLSDGTKVWLNAASSLSYPTAFTGHERKVILSGEGYFEVANNKGMPFRVESSSQEVEVLGTHFNICAYADDHTAITTLLEGSVKLNGKTILQPGEQSVNSGTDITVRQTDTENAIAWKNGKFKFTNENITALMRKVARWYDVEVVYDGPMTNKDFSGSVSRFDHISRILDLLESTNTVHFKVQGRRITVMP